MPIEPVTAVPMLDGSAADSGTVSRDPSYDQLAAVFEQLMYSALGQGTQTVSGFFEQLNGTDEDDEDEDPDDEDGD